MKYLIKRLFSSIKKAVPIALAATLLLAVVMVSSASANSGNEIPHQCGPGVPSVLYDNILDSYKEDPIDPTLRTANFSELFGGAYANEKCQLVIVVNVDEITDEIRSDFYKRAELSKTYGEKLMDFTAGKFKYQHLLEVYEKMNRYLNETPQEEWIAFNGFGIDDELNRVVLGIPVLTEAAISRIKKEMIDDEAVLIVEWPGEYTVEKCAAATPGDGITRSNLSFTIGYRGKVYNGNVGFVTAGHGFTANGQAVYLSGSTSVYGYCNQTNRLAKLN